MTSCAHRGKPYQDPRLSAMVAARDASTVGDEGRLTARDNVELTGHRLVGQTTAGGIVRTDEAATRYPREPSGAAARLATAPRINEFAPIPRIVARSKGDQTVSASLRLLLSPRFSHPPGRSSKPKPRHKVGEAFGSSGAGLRSWSRTRSSTTLRRD